MQMIRAKLSDAEPVAWGVRVLLVADPAGVAQALPRVTGLGGAVEAVDELFTGLEAVIDDPAGYGLFVMVCDDLGGLEAGQRAFALLRAAGCRMPVILASSDCAAQVFPDDYDAPVILRAPLSAVALRLGFEHALRDRLLWRAA